MKKIAVALLAAMALLGACSKKEAASGGSASTGPSQNAAVKVVKVKMAQTGTEQTLAYKAFVVIKDYMEKTGRFEVTIYSGNTLGDDARLVEAVQEGDIEIMFTNTGNLISFVPELGVFAVPFAFPSNEAAYAVLDGPFGKKMLDMMERRGSMVGLGYLEAYAYRELTSSKLIRTPADLRGVKIRVMTNPIHQAIWEQLGAQPTPIPFTELYTGLQQKTVDAQENPLNLVISQKFYEVQKFVTLTHHVFSSGMLFANPAWFNKLDPELQGIIRDAGKAGMLFQREQAVLEYGDYVTTMEAAGVTITELTPAEHKEWQDTVRPVNAMIANEVGGAAIIDELLAAVQAAQ
ncbi:MAG: TRAP transporter substrate-binding protein [Treponema sp.]|jgi:tripartite ATP-independent transporter DctP family solute receptor|nr:TRAP transporter substrate-binding protein [Treponema sp.]